MTTLDRRSLIARSTTAALLALGARLPHPATAQSRRDRDALVAANTAFALDVFRLLREASPGNLVFSPYSVSLALAMTYAGARHDTAEQMAATLGFDFEDADLHRAFAALTADLIERGNQDADPEEGRDPSGLRIANALWGEQTYPFDEAFIDALAADYDAGLELVDFRTDPDQARNDINAWVAEQTEDRIQDIIPENAITEITRLVLANAVWFYGAWQYHFEEGSTRDEPFHLPDATTVDVPFMVQTETFAYAAMDTMQVVDLPYDSDGFSMTIILPTQDAFDAIGKSLEPATLQEALDALEDTEIRLFLPKFEFEYAASLTGVLQILGMTDAFAPDRADFTGMIENGTPPPGENLSIGNVLHKAFIAVDEEGTEAAAATVVIMVGEGMPAPSEPPDVRIDRPFLFAIRDTRTGTILFLGRVTDPRA